MNNEYGKRTNFVKGLKEVISYQFENNNIAPSFPAHMPEMIPAGVNYGGYITFIVEAY